MERRHVFLIGMPGSGKSSVGRELAALLSMRFVDLDVDIARGAGASITELFRERGEEGFRELEHEALASVAAGEAAVVACGGGVILREDNRAVLRDNGRVVLLEADANTLWRRVARGSRPLVRSREDLERLAGRRDGLYRSAADLVVNSDGAPREVARSVAEALA